VIVVRVGGLWVAVDGVYYGVHSNQIVARAYCAAKKKNAEAGTY
jgi:hypothetical protein